MSDFEGFYNKLRFNVVVINIKKLSKGAQK
jgi:hypothetical protein